MNTPPRRELHPAEAGTMSCCTMTADTQETSLDDIRREIDAIDDGMLELLKRRFAASAKVRASKKSDGSIISSPLRPAREALMMRRLIAAGGKNISPDLLVRLWRVILSASTQAQAPMIVHCTTAMTATPDLPVRIAEHFSGMASIAHADTQTCLAALSRNAGDIAVVPPDAPWAEWLGIQPSQTVSIIATLPIIRQGGIPALLVFGHVDSQPSGHDETIVIHRPGGISPSPQLQWQGQSGDWLVSSLAGFLSPKDVHSLVGDGILAGRCPSPIEVKL